MFLSCGKISVPFLGHEFRKGKDRPAPIRCSLNVPSVNPTLKTMPQLYIQGTIERIKEMFKKVEISPSAYDTAWVAMVPSMEFQDRPCFPQCLDWLMENQHPDGSWGIHPGHPLLVKDFLSSTLASILALRKWRVGEQLVQRGLDYIDSNNWAVNDKDQLSPLGFDIMFPGMIEYATELNLSLPLNPAKMKSMFCNRDSEIKRLFENDFKRMAKDLVYFAEGVRDSNHWRCVHLQHLQRRSNGSLLNSPATTAAALIPQYDVQGFQYLSSVLDTYKNLVPTFYPIRVYIRLRMVDTLQRLGVSRYFRDEIKDVLDETYRLWQQRHDEIFSDVACCAMAFRLLRMNSYEVSSDDLAEFTVEEYFSETTTKHSTGLAMILELYKASQLSKNLKDDALQKIHAWTSSFLKKQLVNGTISDKQLIKEVDFALKNCHGVLERLESRQSMELYDVDKIRLLKTSYRCPNIDNRDFVMCAQQDFNICQALHQKELQELERWYKDCRLDHLKFSRHYLYMCYFLIAATLFEPELFDARMAWTQVVMLVTLVDDLLDNRGSREEILNIMELIKVWDGHSSVGYYSKDVEISFTALHKTIDDLAAKALVYQGRCVRHDLISQLQETFNAMIMELEWWSKDVVPTMDEYLSVSCISVGSTPLILATMYFLGEKLPEAVLNSDEFRSLCSHIAVITRLNNDFQTLKKERAERKVNSVSLQVQSDGSITEEEALANIREMIESHRRQLLQMVLDQSEGSLLPKICKDLFWITSKTAYYLYSSTDEFNSPQKMKNHMNAVIYDPVKQLQLALYFAEDEATVE